MQQISSSRWNTAPAGNVDGARIIAAENNAEWLSTGRTYSEQRYSPLASINRDNVNTLGLAWYHEFDADSDRGMEATPLIVDGTLYVTTSWSRVHALDARTGTLKWSYDPRVDGQKARDACCDVVNRGVAIWNGKVFVGALDGRLIALDAGTGKEIWSVQTTDTAWPYTITGAPRVVKGKVLIGNGGAELGVRGYVSAYNADDGKLAWRFYITPNPEGKPDGAASDRIFAGKAAATWFGDGWKKTGGGGTVWGRHHLRPGHRPCLRGHRQWFALESRGAFGRQGRQPVPLFHPRAQAGHRRIRLALPRPRPATAGTTPPRSTS